MKKLRPARLTLLLIVFFLNIIYAPEQVFTENLNKNDVSNVPATRGAIIEALFILQNRRLNISDLKYDVNLALEKAELTVNELFNQKSQNPKHISHYAIYKSNIIKGLYNDYLKEINNFEQEIVKIVEHINQQSTISVDYLEKVVKKGNLIKDILDKRADLIDISFKIIKQEQEFEHQKNIIINREKKLQFLREKLNANASITLNDEKSLRIQTSFIEKLINKLKKELDRKQKTISLKKQSLIKIKNDLALFEDNFYKINNCGINPLDQSEKFPKNWFLIRLARLQNCNKRGRASAGRAPNFVDLV